MELKHLMSKLFIGFSVIFGGYFIASTVKADGIVKRDMKIKR
jgi:hypothetical protein